MDLTLDLVLLPAVVSVEPHLLSLFGAPLPDQMDEHLLGETSQV